VVSNGLGMTPGLRLTLLALLLSGTPQLASQVAESGRLVTVGKQKMFLNCTGNGSDPTMILEAGTGDTSEVWAAVQKRAKCSLMFVAMIASGSEEVTSWFRPTQLMKSSAIFIHCCRPLVFPHRM
jgi:hypothetical protein